MAVLRVGRIRHLLIKKNVDIVEVSIDSIREKNSALSEPIYDDSQLDFD
jgi:hypothetical protein